MTPKKGYERAPLLLCCLFVLLMVPFLDKAAHIDDPLFLWSAEQILRTPLNFYGFDVNWYGTAMPMAEVMQNPPLTSYYLALPMALSGGAEGTSDVLLHLAMLLPGIFFVLGMYRLSRLFCRKGWLATMMAMLSPAVLLAAGGFMSETLLLPLWVWAVYFHIQGERQGRIVLTLVAACLVSFAVLVKFNALALILLLFAYSILHHFRLRPGLLALLLPFVALLGYQWWTSALYGQGLLTSAMHYSVTTKSSIGSFGLNNLLEGLAFLGGCIPACLVLLPVLWRSRGRFIALAAFIALFAILQLSGEFCGVSFDSLEYGGATYALQASLLMLLGAAILATILHASIPRTLRREQLDLNKDNVFLTLWVLGQFVFVVFLNWTISARNMLPLVPPVCIFVAAALERRPKKAVEGNVAPQKGVCFASLVLSGCLAFSLAWCDYRWANACRTAAFALIQNQDRLPQNVWFAGHWGFQYYMEQGRFRPLDHASSVVSMGDVLILPRKMLQRPLPVEYFTKVQELTLPGCGILSLQHEKGLAGFYSTVFGPLPYVFAVSEPHRFEFRVAMRTIRFKQGKKDS